MHARSLDLIVCRRRLVACITQSGSGHSVVAPAEIPLGGLL
jgi:hypothetical protein